MIPQTAVPATPAAESAAAPVSTAQLLTAYRASFDADFDLQAFEGDDFYAFQVLERAIREGAPGLREAAKEMERMRLEAVESIAEIDYSTPLVPVAPRLRGQARLVPRNEPERRTPAVKGTGHVRLGNREIVLLSQMRVQYRKT